MRDISKNISAARKAKNLTQDELAARLFVTRQTVSNYETGKSRPDIDMLMSIAAALDTDINTLLYGKQKDPKTKAPRSLWIGLGVTVLLGLLLLFFFEPAKRLMRTEYIVAPAYIFQLLFLPLFYIFLGWTSMFGVGLISGAKPLDRAWVRWLRRIIYIALLFYFVIMLPDIIHSLKTVLVDLHLDKLRETYPLQIYGFHSAFSIRPRWLNMVQGKIWLLTSARSVLFLFFGFALWLLGFPEKKDRSSIALLMALCRSPII